MTLIALTSAVRRGVVLLMAACAFQAAWAQPAQIILLRPRRKTRRPGERPPVHAPASSAPWLWRRSWPERPNCSNLARQRPCTPRAPRPGTAAAALTKRSSPVPSSRRSPSKPRWPRATMTPWPKSCSRIDPWPGKSVVVSWPPRLPAGLRRRSGRDPQNPAPGKAPFTTGSGSSRSPAAKPRWPTCRSGCSSATQRNSRGPRETAAVSFVQNRPGLSTCPSS